MVPALMSSPRSLGLRPSTVQPTEKDVPTHIRWRNAKGNECVTYQEFREQFLEGSWPSI